MSRPLPVIDALNAHYWEGARAHRLVISRCAACEYWIHPPRRNCPHCRSERVEPREASGKGRVYTWSVMHVDGNPGFEDRLPYAVVVVELHEQRGLFTIGNIDCPLDKIEIGMPLEVTFEDLSEGVTLPQWRPARGEARA